MKKNFFLGFVMISKYQDQGHNFWPLKAILYFGPLEALNFSDLSDIA